MFVAVIFFILSNGQTVEGRSAHVFQSAAECQKSVREDAAGILVKRPDVIGLIIKCERAPTT